MFERNDRLIELIQQQVSELLRSVKDPGLSGFITLTGATLAKDRKRATIFYSILGSEDDKAATASALNRAAPFLRHQLKSRLTLKVIPELEFQYDSTPERANRIDSILEKIKAEQSLPPIPEIPPPPSEGQKTSRAPRKPRAAAAKSKKK